MSDARASLLAARYPTTEEGACDMTVGRYDDNTWAVYDAEGEVLAYGFFESQDAYGWIEALHGTELVA